jgi:dephospho-CoA kinase|tara:strand:- start:305 stop:967 length:663 start_codon:yes stop_codon:yes gene_type:complete
MKTFHELQEGLYDPNIFKAFFLAGGPGSGKSYVAMKSTGGTGLKTINSDDAFEHLLNKAGLSLKMPPEETEPRDVVRDKAKELTTKREKNFLDGRLGLIIDGTGREVDKILRQKAKLEELGYDTYMIFVNTSLDVALERNADRPRSVAEPIVVKSWKDVQANIGKFSNIFRAGFIVVDNNNAGEDVFKEVYKRVKGLLRKKVKNARAKNWMASELAKRQR